MNLPTRAKQVGQVPLSYNYKGGDMNDAIDKYNDKLNQSQGRYEILKSRGNKSIDYGGY